MRLAYLRSAGCSKSISKLSAKAVVGRRAAPTCRLRRLRRACSTRMKRFGAFCSSMPADCSRNTNGAALPSMIGTSAAVSSTNALSIPSPAKADIRCSTVPTRAPSCSMRRAERRLGHAQRAGGNVHGLRQIESAGTRCRYSPAPGRKVMYTLSPECRPMPLARIDSLECVDARCPSLRNESECRSVAPIRLRLRRQTPTTLRTRRGRENYHSAVTAGKEIAACSLSPPADAGTPEYRATLRACRCRP